MKDIKLLIIIILVGVVGILTGVLIEKSSIAPATQPPVYGSTDDGKLAKEYKDKVVVQVIKDNAKDLQKCYFELLENNPVTREGILTILIKVEEDGKISSTKIIKNEFSNKEIAHCVTKKIGSYYLAPPPYGINRYISHTLAFKTEANAKKEAERRAETNKPPKMLPVHP